MASSLWVSLGEAAAANLKSDILTTQGGGPKAEQWRQKGHCWAQGYSWDAEHCTVFLKAQEPHKAPHVAS